MKNFDWKYIFKRLLTFFIIFVILSFVRSCKVKASTYIVDGDGINSYYFINNNANNPISLTYNIDINSIQKITNFRLGFVPYDYSRINSASIDGLYNGQYLFDVYFLTNGGIHPTSCSQISTNFQNIDMNSGNWVSNQIKSNCLEVSSYHNGGWNYLHILFNFTLNAPTEFAQEFRFLINDGNGFFLEQNKFKVFVGGLYDYDSTIIEQFRQNQLNEQQLMQQQQQTSLLQQQLQQQHQDSVNTQNAINGVNSSITNDNIDSADSKASEWSSKSLSDNAVANMVTMPITLLQAYLNGLNGSCSSFSLGTLYDHELTLPCINLSSYFGSTLWNVIDILFSGFMIYAIGRKFVRIFNDFTNLRDSQVDELYGGGN